MFAMILSVSRSWIHGEGKNVWIAFPFHNINYLICNVLVTLFIISFTIYALLWYFFNSICTVIIGLVMVCTKSRVWLWERALTYHENENIYSGNFLLFPFTSGHFFIFIKIKWFYAAQLLTWIFLMTFFSFSFWRDTTLGLVFGPFVLKVRI